MTGEPWNKILCRDPYTVFYENVEGLENRCLNAISKTKGIVEINAFDMQGEKVLINLCKSKIKKV